MDFNAAKSALQEGYTAAGLELVGQQGVDLVLRYHDTLLIVLQEDVEEYAACASFRAGAQVTPAECGICSPTYREQVVQPLDPIRWRYMPPLEMGFIFGEPETDGMYVTLGAASTEFVNFFRFDPTYLSICLERLGRMMPSDQPIDIRQGFYRPPTIQVHELDENSVDAAMRQSSQVIDYCLFELSYLKHLPVGLADEWPARRRMGEDGFIYGEELVGNVLPLPPAEFNADVVQFYQLGTSSRIPVLQFWSFYQVIEYFFVRTSDEQLHRQLAQRLKDPRFKTSATQLDRLVQDVFDHLATTDELVMLTSVLEKYVDEAQLIDFIKQYEAYLDEEMYSKRRRLFGEDVDVKLTTGAVIENVAKTVYIVRKALSYSADRNARTARNLSFSRLSEIVKPEIPLMKFLAERVIVGSAT